MAKRRRAKRRNITLEDLRDVNATACKSCPFVGDNWRRLMPVQNLERYQHNLLGGGNHICHSTEWYCRGGRDWQIQIYYRLGLLPEESDEAWYAFCAQMRSSSAQENRHG